MTRLFELGFRRNGHDTLGGSIRDINLHNHYLCLLRGTSQSDIAFYQTKDRSGVTPMNSAAHFIDYIKQQGIKPQ